MLHLNTNVKAIFFDDAPENLKTVETTCNSSIQSVLIPTSKELPPDIDKEKNVYYLMLTENNIRPFYDNLSGIQEPQINALKEWVTNTKGRRDVFFDWDYTLSMFNGVFIPVIPPGSSLKGVYKAYLWKTIPTERIYEDMLLFLMGGKERLALLRSMFKFLKDAGIKITILTNNPLCIDPYKKNVFKNLVYKLCGHTNVKFICGAEKKFDYDKGLALKARARAVCITEKCKKKRAVSKTMRKQRKLHS